MKKSLDDSIQNRIFEKHEYTDTEDIDVRLYRIIDQSLKVDSASGLDIGFADRVVAQAMSKPVWVRTLNAFLWVAGILILVSGGIGSLLYLVDFAMPKVSFDLDLVFAQKWYFVFTVAVVFIVEIADMLFVRKGAAKNILSLFD
ncbi:hypothetical protein [Reichenbachiella sp. MALMAid0571]|uniref:hypothetical protein n=1 Tax=Reichenbachiella sp. MALMAid0571 TaxID=3143939 RepID=UPI0032DF4856